MSLRTKVLFWIIAVNLCVGALLLVAIQSNVEAQRNVHNRMRDRFRENRKDNIERLGKILLFTESLSQVDTHDISENSIPQRILQWSDWRFFEDAVVLGKDFVVLEGDIIHSQIELNPLGNRKRSPFFDRSAALRMLKTAIQENRRVVEGDSIAIPIHTRTGREIEPWGGAFVRPRFPEIAENGGFFDLTVFWIAMIGGTVVLIAASFVILSRVVIKPVEELAAVADKVAEGNYSVQCAPSSAGDEVGRLIDSINYMVREVGDYHRHLEIKVQEEQEKVRLAERHLVVSQRLASTGKLAAGIAHEINNPIGGMINAAIRLKDDARKGSRTELYLDLIIEGLDRIKETVRKVLAFSPRQLEKRQIEVAQILEDADALIHHRLLQDEIELSYQISPPDLAVFCEPGEIRQVILNLLINAADAVEGGSGSIEIRAFPDGAEKTVVLEVGDNGCGMSGEELTHAFDPFFSTKPAGEGTGLGLSIAHNIVTSHGGRLEAESKKGSGTLIRLVLPQIRSEKAEES